MSHIADSDVYKSELERVSQYAQTKIDVVLKDMLEKLFVSTPEDPIDVSHSRRSHQPIVSSTSTQDLSYEL